MKNFDWHTTFNIAYNQNKILEISTPETQLTPSLRGYAVGSIFAYPFGGLDSEGYPLFITSAGNKVSAEEYFNIKTTENGSYASNLSVEERRNRYKYAGTTDLYGREVFSILSESKDSKSESTVFSTLATWYKHLHLTPLLFLTGV